MDDTLSKYFSGELTQTETSELFKRMNFDGSLKAEFISLQNTYALLQVSELSKDEGEGKKGFQEFKYRLQTKKQRRAIREILQYAAVVAVLIASTFFATNFFYNNSSNGTNTLYVPAGQRAQLTLPDGTSVWLNAQSTLTYPSQFTSKTRRVTVSGEAYFDVAENPKKPFVVSTQNVEMKVLGTQFNVYSYPDAGYIQTNLVEGSLMVYGKQSPNINVMLKPNEQVVIVQGKMTVTKTPNQGYFLWKEGIYAFENERLLDIIKKLQLYYDVKIVVKDPEIFNVPYTGKFRQRDGIDEILKVIQKIRNFNIQKDSETNTITLTKE